MRHADVNPLSFSRHAVIDNSGGSKKLSERCLKMWLLWSYDRVDVQHCAIEDGDFIKLTAKDSDSAEFVLVEARFCTFQQC